MVSACVVFEDPFVDRLRPVCLARPACNITCGALTLFDLLEDLPLPKSFYVRPHLRALLERSGHALAGRAGGSVLFVNAGLAPDPRTVARLKQLTEKGEPFLALNDQRVTAAMVGGADGIDWSTRSAQELVAHLLGCRAPVLDDEFPILTYSFDIIRHHERLLPGHLSRLVERGGFEEIAPGVHAAGPPTLASHVVFDTSDGPIVMGKNVRIRPFSYIAGPVRIGSGAIIIDHASIKHGASLGHTVKAGGEIEAAVIEPYSNKQHHGFLGHAYVGSWVNLGAGTSNSDLKNTYGEVAVDVDGKSTPTGLQFVGCTVGDFTKTAINTSIFTGKAIGVGSFVYGFVTTNVPSFTNYARSFGQVTEVSAEIAVKTQTRVASRRKVTMDAVDIQLMRDLFDLTRSERQLSSDQIVL